MVSCTNSIENKNILFQRTYSETHKVGNLLPSRKCLRILIPSWKKDHTLAFSMRCMTDHHLKLCRQGCKFCISSLASNGERKKFPFPPFLKCLWCSPHPGEFLVPAQPLERPDQKETGCFMYLLLWMSNGAEGLVLCTTILWQIWQILTPILLKIAGVLNGHT